MHRGGVGRGSTSGVWQATGRGRGRGRFDCRYFILNLMIILLSIILELWKNMLREEKFHLCKILFVYVTKYELSVGKHPSLLNCY